MEVREGHSTLKRILPSITSGMRTASRFAVVGLMLSIGGDDRPLMPVRPKMHFVSTDVNSAHLDVWENPDKLQPGTTMDIIGSKLLIVGETKIVDGKEIKDEDIELEVRRNDSEIELIVNGKAYRIQDTMSVDVGKSILSAKLTDGIITIVTDQHGTATVDTGEVKRIVRDLAAARYSPVRLGVTTNFAPEGVILCSAIDFSRICRGWKPGDKERYTIGFEVAGPDSTLAMAPSGR